MRIVVVDDDLSQRTYLSLALKQIGHEVIAIGSPMLALSAIESSRADLIICDVRMPEMSGTELVRRIRAKTWDRYIYILMVTALSDPESRALSLELGADDFMTKPTDLMVLEARLRSAGRLIAYERELQLQRARVDDAYYRLRSDLQAAAAAQRMLLPSGPQQLRDATLASLLIPSADVSGDMFNCFGPVQRFSGLYLADASGHGVRAALSTVALGSMVSEEFFWRMAVDETFSPRPEHAVHVLDRRFAELAFEDSYFAIFVALIDHEGDRLTYCQAGVPSPLLIRADGTVELIGDGGLPVGLVSGAEFYQASVHFSSGDRIVVYSDGILDAIGPRGDPLGQEGLIELVKKTRQHAVVNQLDAMERSLRAWTPTSDFPDDISVMIVER